MAKKDKKVLLQFVARLAIFLIFLMGVFVEIPLALLYLLLPLIVANLVLGFMNKKRSIVTNVVLLLIYPLLFVVLVEYLVILLGTVLSFIHALTFYFEFRKSIF